MTLAEYAARENAAARAMGTFSVTWHSAQAARANQAKSERNGKPRSTQLRALEYMTKTGRQTTTIELGAALGISKQAAQSALRCLQNEGKVKKTGGKTSTGAHYWGLI